jgi:hypothetical protein
MNLTKEQIYFLDRVCVSNYTYGARRWTLNPNGEVDVDGFVSMGCENLSEIPVKFGRVSEWVDCRHNKLTTLKNCPNYIGGDFYLYNNNLTDYFKSIKEEDFPHWKNLDWVPILYEYPFLINIGKKHLDIIYPLRDILNDYPQTKLYYKD